MDSAGELYFDRVSQIRMDHWSKGRLALVGDAAFCPSLLAGQGSALAMAAAYSLASELKNSKGNYRVAFANYERLLGPFIARKQKMAERFATSFVPRNKIGLFFRNRLSRLLTVPWVADFAFSREFADKISLPE
jgi:2-polyprenyl-6-methoxyphenol hydroxylase-like FAD-dependent oxidoreductase